MLLRLRMIPCSRTCGRFSIRDRAVELQALTSRQHPHGILRPGVPEWLVAVLDTGVDYSHPDLAANIFTGPICPGGIVCHGINLAANIFHDANDPFDDNGHGTHVSGTIGAVGNNALGVTGINWNVTILPCKFLASDGAGATSDAITCLDFIKSLKDAQGLNIVASNNSWGGGPFRKRCRMLSIASDRAGSCSLLPQVMTLPTTM